MGIGYWEPNTQYLIPNTQTPAHALAALELGSCSIINVKPARVGGLAQALRIHDLCLERGAPVWCGGLLETGVGMAHNLALASLPGYTLPGDVSASERYFVRDIIEPPVCLNPDGTIDVPQGPGIGVQLDRAFLDEVTVRRKVFVRGKVTTQPARPGSSDPGHLRHQRPDSTRELGLRAAGFDNPAGARVVTREKSMNTVAPEKAGFSAARLSRIGAVMQRYVDQGKIAGCVTLVARRGSVVHFEKFGYQDLANGKALGFDTIFRIYSMTKPVTSVALMMLYERGLFQLTDPVSKFIPAFQEIKVFVSEDQRAELERAITIHDLLTHTAGFSYGYEEMTGLPVDRLYDQAGLWDPAIDNREMTRRIAALPLARQPGRAWQYSVATNVVGYLVELLSGLSLGQFFEQEIFKPLGMVDTAFTLPPDKISRLATLYALTENGLQALELDPWGFDFVNNRLQYGGGGLVSTVGDYARFAQMLLNKGQLDGARLLGRKTVELMTVNHLPPSLLPLLDGEEPRPGVGFGLGFAVTLDVAQSGLLGSVGAHSWSGMANTHFWVDPREQLVAVIALQCFPFGVHPIIDDFQTLVYQALE